MSFNSRPYTPPGPTAPPIHQGYGTTPDYGRSQSYGGSRDYGRTQSYGGSQGYGQQPPSYNNQYGRAQSMAPPQYSNSSSYNQYQQPQGYPPAAAPSPYAGGPAGDGAIIQIFQQADVDRSGTIDANELVRLLTAGPGESFTLRTCRLMIHLFAENQADPSRIGREGFVKLWKELTLWHDKFMKFDRDNSGTIDVEEFQQLLRSEPFYFAIPPSVLEMLLKKYDHSDHSRYGKKSIGYGQFVECGFIVKGLTEKFRDHDRAKNGNATFDYTDFMLMVIPYVAS